VDKRVRTGKVCLHDHITVGATGAVGALGDRLVGISLSVALSWAESIRRGLCCISFAAVECFEREDS